jgi:hypothetical protein
MNTRRTNLIGVAGVKVNNSILKSKYVKVSAFVAARRGRCAAAASARAKIAEENRISTFNKIKSKCAVDII